MNYDYFCESRDNDQPSLFLCISDLPAMEGRTNEVK